MSEVNNGSTVINNLSKIVDRLSADGIESHFESISSQRPANLFFPMAIARRKNRRPRKCRSNNSWNEFIESF